ncbi:hypothetical protein [Pararhodobacter oceanensis]|uniref:RDD domain-containing protein n=1 Tax=Pararhodobacter oceanensis TaxID=2172121 RepID=A0A2T8HY65_9RHOB|nr:hypothetical protein [Pararhodobacter oceanensis]PVH30378.1 hypothetical protein DDE20_02175 [Pararhodobacter oceanensis]
MSNSVSTWRIVLAALLDFLTVFLLGGFVIAALTGNTTEGGFSLNGWPAVVLLVLIVAYFVLGKRLGGTLWKRILGAVR